MKSLSALVLLIIASSLLVIVNITNAGTISIVPPGLASPVGVVFNITLSPLTFAYIVNITGSYTDNVKPGVIYSNYINYDYNTGTAWFVDTNMQNANVTYVAYIVFYPTPYLMLINATVDRGVVYGFPQKVKLSNFAIFQNFDYSKATGATVSASVLQYQIFNGTYYVLYAENGTTIFDTNNNIVYKNSKIVPVGFVGQGQVYIDNVGISHVKKYVYGTVSLVSRVPRFDTTNAYFILYSSKYSYFFVDHYYYYNNTIFGSKLWFGGALYSQQKEPQFKYDLYNITFNLDNINKQLQITIYSKTNITIAVSNANFQVALGYYYPNGVVKIVKTITNLSFGLQQININYQPSFVLPTSFNFTQITSNSDATFAIYAIPLAMPNVFVNNNYNYNSNYLTQSNNYNYQTTTNINTANISSPVKYFNASVIYNAIAQHKIAFFAGIGILLLLLLIAVTATRIK
jgi:hypothetical protein